MSKRKPKTRSTETPGGNPSTDSPSQGHSAAHLTSSAAMRETIESVVIAFMLAFLFRTFEAEAFVIPTGSMAPTLMGMHKDAVCPECGHPFRVSASSEVDQNNRRTGMVVESGICPICHARVDFHNDRPPRDGEPQHYYPSYKGDRILVGKSAYETSDPERWDVAVFKFPGEAQTNYIKRIVGLPRETVEIHRGDLRVRPEGSEQFTIARKPEHKLLAMLQTVYDNDFQAQRLIAAGFPQRWQAEDPEQLGGWQASDDHRSFSTDGKAERPAWFRYRHFVPGSRQWQSIQEGWPLGETEPELISDFCAYNTHVDRDGWSSYQQNTSALGLHWVGDLCVECELEVRSPTGQVTFELVEGGRKFHAVFDLATGEAVLGIDGIADFSPTQTTALRGPGTYQVRFANIDDALTLWVNGEPVRFEKPTTYERLNNDIPTPDDLSPVGIGSHHAAVAIRHLRLFRDIYYIALRKQAGSASDFLGVSYDDSPYPSGMNEQSRHAFLSTPGAWPRAFEKMRSVEFTLEADRFLALGDNSARSKDSRLWEGDEPPCEFYVRRDLLVGKALFVYWPHSWNRVPGTEIPFPLFPNFERMKFVR